MTSNEHPVTTMVRLAERAYKGENMAIRAACRAARCDRSAIADLEEACALLIENGWSWDDVLTANS